MTHNNADIYRTFTENHKDEGPSFAPTTLVGGTTVARKYVLIKCLGRGGMGEAWLAEQIVERKYKHEIIPRFVLKIIPGEVQSDAVEMDKVRESYLRIVGLKHANICTLHPLERDERLGYVLVMEYIPGSTLRQYVHAKPGKRLEPAEVVRLLMPVAEALDYAHKKKVIHRDIKPANIMVTPEGETQIIDFDLAAQIRTSMTQVSKVRMSTSGTLPYMAPEQWKGEYQDAKTDQYALGVVTYELLSGRLPFESHEPSILPAQVINLPVPPIRGISDALNAVLVQSLAKNREDRFENCREFIRNLEKVLARPQMFRDAANARPEPKPSTLDSEAPVWEDAVDSLLNRDAINISGTSSSVTYSSSTLNSTLQHIADSQERKTMPHKAGEWGKMSKGIEVFEYAPRKIKMSISINNDYEKINDFYLSFQLFMPVLLSL